MLLATTLLAVLLAPPGPSPAPAPHPDPVVGFRQAFESTRAGDAPIPERIERLAPRFRYVFVGGMGGERGFGYFVQNTKELRALGVPKTAIHSIFPGSRDSIDANADKLRAEIPALAAKGPERLVLIGHSKGACGLLAFALREPRFVSERVEAIFLVQGPFGGSALADYVRGEGPEIDRSMTLRYRLTARFIGAVAKVLLKPAANAGLLGLSTEEARKFWRNRIAECDQGAAIVGPKVFYVRSQAPPSRLARFRRAVGAYLSTYDGPNDGVVAVRDQSLPGLGTPLDVIDCGHGDLTQRAHSRRSPRLLRRAFTHALLAVVTRFHGDPSAEPDRPSTRRDRRRRVDAAALRLPLPSFLGLTLAPRAESPKGYRVLGSDRGKVAIVGPDGKVEWEVANPVEVHDLSRLPNGNILFSTRGPKVVEMTPDKTVVWSYESKPKPGYNGRVEVHAFQRLPDGRTMIAETGNLRIIEVDSSGSIVKEVPLTVEHPDPHRDTRMVRKLANGHYLVCHEGDAKVREYDDTGKVVWTYSLDLAGRPRTPGHGPEGHGTEVFGAIRLDSGNTLIATGNGNRVIEVDPKGTIVWSIGHDELPGIRLAWVTTLEALPNGNILFGNCHAGPENPQLIEVTRDKKVVWTFKDFTTFGNSLAATQVLR